MNVIEDKEIGFNVVSILGKTNDGSETGGFQVIETQNSTTLYSLIRGIINDAPQGGWSSIDQMKTAGNITKKIDDYGSADSPDFVEFNEDEVKMIKHRMSPESAKWKINSPELRDALIYLSELK